MFLTSLARCGGHFPPSPSIRAARRDGSPGSQAHRTRGVARPKAAPSRRHAPWSGASVHAWRGLDAVRLAWGPCALRQRLPRRALGPTDPLPPSLPVALWGAVQLRRETRGSRAQRGDPSGSASALVGRISQSTGALHDCFIPSRPSSVCGIDHGPVSDRRAPPERSSQRKGMAFRRPSEELAQRGRRPSQGRFRRN